MDKKTSKWVGVKDIAAKAGVSIGTVDRVLHNRGEVKKETREKILSIVDELGYKPNVLARSLSTRKTTRVAIVIPDSSENNPYWKKPINGINRASDELSSYNIDIILEVFDASTEASFKEVLKRVSEENFDGVVLNPAFIDASYQYINIFDSRNIAYVFIDGKIKGVGNLGYFGQDAEQSGLVAARLMDSIIPERSKILIVKLSNKKVFSQHIESRITGFLRYFKNKPNIDISKFTTLEIDLSDCNEPDLSLSEFSSNPETAGGVFVPNSRAFKVADFIARNNLKNVTLIGYDLVDNNIQHLKNGNISYLLSQKPEEQAYKALMALFDHLIAKKKVRKTNCSPIDIIIRENIDYYL